MIMRKDIDQFRTIAVRGRMAFGLACLESLTKKFNYLSPKYNELLNLLWSYTETPNLGDWDEAICSEQWRAVEKYGLWLETEHMGAKRQGSPIYNMPPFQDAPKDVVGLLGLCMRIGASHLYGGFVPDASEWALEKILNIMEENDVAPPPLNRFQNNKVDVSHKDNGLGFPAPRSFYTD